MNLYNLPRLAQAILGGFLIGSSLIGYAQDSSAPGVVRISDAKPAGVPVHTVGFGKHQMQGEYHNMGGAYIDGCPECYADCPSGHCHHGHCHFCQKLFREHYCKHSADHGFSIPERNPIYRRGVQYNQYFPSSWYGTPGGGIAAGQVYPTVYQPTDTTQLGYSYQHVPFWMPNPNALPARPIPSQWHVMTPPAQPLLSYQDPGYYGHHGWGHHKRGRHGGRGEFYCPPGDGWVESPAMMPSAMPTTAQPVPQSSNPPPAPIPDAAVPKNDSAQTQPIRRAGFQQ